MMGRRIYWTMSDVRKKFATNKPFSIDIGEAPVQTREMMDHERRQILGDKVFEMNNRWQRHHGTYHFGDEETRSDNIPLTDGDLEMIPSLWRSPERIEPGGTRSTTIHEIDTLDGGTLVGVFEIGGKKAYLKTLYKRKDT